MFRNNVLRLLHSKWFETSVWYGHAVRSVLIGVWALFAHWARDGYDNHIAITFYGGIIKRLHHAKWLHWAAANIEDENDFIMSSQVLRSVDL